MPGGHEYQPANTTDRLSDDSGSDLELDLQELGPRSVGDHGRSGSERVNVIVGNGEIPLQTMRPPGRAAGRRMKKFEESRGSGNVDEEEQRPESRDGSTPDGQVIGDSTPLLQLNQDGQADAPSAGGKRSRLSPRGLFRSAKRGAGGLGHSEGEDEIASSRTISIGEYPPPRYPSNAISNAKYTPWSFLPRTLYNEFSFFINLYFLIVALSQLIPQLRIGVLWTYMAPLAFVLSVTLGKEAYDDVQRRKRDVEANREQYTMLRFHDPEQPQRNKRSKQKAPRRRRANTVGHRRLEAIEEEEENTGGIEVEEVLVKSKNIKVGDVLVLGKDDRVPADVIILKSVPSEKVVDAGDITPPDTKEEPDLLFDQDKNDSEETTIPSEEVKPQGPAASSEGGGVGETFIRTDQLDGETDWKLRIASPLTQTLEPSEFVRLSVTAGRPSRKVNEFLGRLELRPKPSQERDSARNGPPKSTAGSLSIDNTAWANTVLASNATVLAVVVYTGAQTRQALSTAPSRSKVGLLEYEINNLTKILCVLTVTLSGVLVGLAAYNKTHLPFQWYISLCRFLILFSSIIPMSLRVNLDLGKTVYAYFIHHDKEMDGAVVRTSTIPEDLGRIEYLLSDKTGTLTQNGR